jgi:amidase
VAFSIRAPNGAQIEPQCAQATVEAARLCESLGHEVVEAEPEFDVEAVQDGFLAVFQANTMANIARATGGHLPKEGLVEPLTRAIAERGLAMSAPDYIRNLQVLHRETRHIAQFFTRHDIWLTPTLATPPPPIGYFDANSSDVENWLAKLLAFIPYTYLFNITGQPAMSVPLGQTKDCLPIGCHFAARYGEEELLFSLAGQLEQAAPWKNNRPSMKWLNE